MTQSYFLEGSGSITCQVMAVLKCAGQGNRMSIAIDQGSFGDQLRLWRQQRHLSQLDLALDAEISARHLSFVETGRSRPSREMVMRLAECLSLPLRNRNALLLSAGFAPAYRERSLDDPALGAAREGCSAFSTGTRPSRRWRSTGIGTSSRIMTWCRCCSTASRRNCSRGRAMCCASASTRGDLRRASSIWANGSAN